MFDESSQNKGGNDKWRNQHQSLQTIIAWILQLFISGMRFAGWIS
jgi:hypothetical protein